MAENETTTNRIASSGNSERTPVERAGNYPDNGTTKSDSSSDSTSDNNNCNDSSSIIGAGPKTKKRRRDEGAGALRKDECGDHMNDSFPATAAAKKKESSSEEGKDGAGEGRTCVSCRKSKVKCSKGSPCKRCSRLKLECVAQVRGRGRPVASGAGLRKSAKSEAKGGANGHGGVGGGGSAVGVGARDSSSYPSSGGSNSNSFLARRGSGALPPSVGVLSSSSQSALRAGIDGGAADGGGGGPGSGGAGSADSMRNSFGFSSPSTAGVAQPITATGLSCPPPLGHNNGAGRGSSVAEDVAGAVGGGLGGGGGGGGGVGYVHQYFDPSSRPFQSHLLPSGRSLPSPSAAARHPQQHQQGAPHGSFPAARTFTHPLLQGSSASDAVPGRMAATAPGRPPMTSTGGRGSISSGSSWRAVFHGEDVGTTGSSSRAKCSSSLSSDGGFGGFNGKDLLWAETIDEHKDAVAAAAAAAAAADGEEFLTRSTDDKARWLMDVEQYAGASGADSDERLPEAAEGGADPTDTIVTGFWKLFSEQEVHRPKAVLVIRHWALCALERRSTGLMRKTVDMARALCINVAEILNDYGIYAMFHELLREAEAGNTIEPARPVKLNHQKAPPYIQELLSQFAAVSTRVVLRGQSYFIHNEMCTRLFMSTEQANELYASNKQDVWATCIHPDDHKTFFDNLSIELFRTPGHQSEFRKICKCREHTGTVFLALVRFRYEFQDEGNYAAFGLSMLPLPESPYLQKVDQPTMTTTTLENGHEGATAAAAASAVGAAGAATSSSSAGLGAATATAPATKVCDASLPVPGSSEKSSVASNSSSLSAAGAAAAAASTAAAAAAGGGASAGGGRGHRGSRSGDFGDGGDGGDGGDFQPLPPLGVMQQRVGSLPLPSQGRVNAWGSHDVGGAVSTGDTVRGLDDSITSSRGSINGGGGVEGFQDGIGGGWLGLDSGRGGLSGSWVRAPSRGEMRVVDGL